MPLTMYLTALANVLTFSQCNEVHPVCGGCQRHGVECIYTRSPSDRDVKASSENGGKAAIKDASPKTEVTDLNGSLGYPESEKRRLLELRLMFQWLTKSGLAFPQRESTQYQESLLQASPSNAMKHPAWLYGLFTFAAIHIFRTATSPAEQDEFRDVFHRYLDLALQEHRRDVAELCQENANAVCMTSNILRNCTQAIAQERDLIPYTPPSQWMYMMNGSGDVFKTAWSWVCDDETSLARRVGTDGPDLTNLKDIFAPEKREVFKHLLYRSPLDEGIEPWDLDTQNAYELTLSYIGSLQVAMDHGEPLVHSFRRVMAFCMFIPKRFIDLVDEGRPRALVVMAYYFSYLARLRTIWWIGDTGRREILGIQSVLKSPWAEMLEWPLSTMEDIWEVHPDTGRG